MYTVGIADARARSMGLLVDDAAQGATVCLLSVRVNTYRSAVQLQPVGVLLV